MPAAFTVGFTASEPTVIDSPVAIVTWYEPPVGAGASIVTSAAASFGTVAGLQFAAVFQSPEAPFSQL